MRREYTGREGLSAVDVGVGVGVGVGVDAAGADEVEEEEDDDVVAIAGTSRDSTDEAGERPEAGVDEEEEEEGWEGRGLVDLIIPLSNGVLSAPFKPTLPRLC